MCIHTSNILLGKLGKILFFISNHLLQHQIVICPSLTQAERRMIIMVSWQEKECCFYKYTVIWRYFNSNLILLSIICYLIVACREAASSTFWNIYFTKIVTLKSCQHSVSVVAEFSNYGVDSRTEQDYSGENVNKNGVGWWAGQQSTHLGPWRNGAYHLPHQISNHGCDGWDPGNLASQWYIRYLILLHKKVSTFSSIIILWIVSTRWAKVNNIQELLRRRKVSYPRGNINKLMGECKVC